MSPKQSKARLFLYVSISGATTASAGIAALDFANPKQVAAYALGIVVTMLVTARSYIDQSPNQVITDAVTTVAKRAAAHRLRGDRPEDL